MKAIRFLFKKIYRYDAKMIPMMIIYTILSGIYPFLWVLVPAKIIFLSYSKNYIQMVGVLAIGGVLAILASFILAFFKGNYRMRMNNVRYHLIRDLMRYNLEMPYENTLNVKTLDEIKLASISVLNPQSGAGGVILTLLQIMGEIVASIGFIGLFFTLSPVLIVIVTSLIVCTFLLSQKATKKEYEFYEDFEPLKRKVDVLLDFSNDPRNKKDIIVYDLYSLITSYVDGYVNQSYVLMKSIYKKTFHIETAIALLDFARDGLLYSWLIYQFLNNKIDISQFYLYTTGVLSFVTIAQQGMRDFARIQKESKQFENYMKIIEKANCEEDSAASFLLEDKGLGIEIEIRDLCFRYPGGGQDVLSHLNLHLKLGEKLALVGENGSGKSTLINLLCRLYRPDSGEILINGKNIWDLPAHEYFHRLSVVFQDANILPFSIQENISFSEDSNANLLEEAIIESEFKEIVKTLPKGLNTSLLRILDDDGMELSGGQKQKLLLARALYKKDSSFLILDEPTAALDSLAEHALYEQYNKMAHHKTSIFISHRLASTRFCDHIAFLKNGKIEEYGTHEELMAHNGCYAELYEIQSKNYRDLEREVSYEAFA